MHDKPDESIVLKRRDPLSDIVLNQNKDALAEFLDEPLPAIAEAITGLIASGPKVLMQAPARIAQGALKGRLFQQFGVEVQELRNKGKIPDDFADKKYGYQTFVEVIKVIEEESPDEDRMEAIRALFFAVNKMNSTDHEKTLNYELLQIAKKLTSNEILILGASYRLYQQLKSQGKTMPNTMPADQWTQQIAQVIGHKLSALVSRDEGGLVTRGLLVKANPNLTVNTHFYRLTDLGVKFCEAIENYKKEVKEEAVTS